MTSDYNRQAVIYNKYKTIKPTTISFSSVNVKYYDLDDVFKLTRDLELSVGVVSHGDRCPTTNTVQMTFNKLL